MSTSLDTSRSTRASVSRQLMLFFSTAVAVARAGGTWHLAGLAVAPEHRGRGVARALLDPMLTTTHLPGHGEMPEWWLMQGPPTHPRGAPRQHEEVHKQ